MPRYQLSTWPRLQLGNEVSLDVLQGLVHRLGQGGGIGVGAGGQPGMLAAAEGMLNRIELGGIGGKKFEGDLLRRQLCRCRVHGSMAVDGGIVQDYYPGRPG